MTTLSTATSNFSSLVTALVQRNSEDILAASYPHASPAVVFRGTFEKGHNQITFPAFAQLAANTTALTEGTPPTAQTMTIATDTVTATQLGWTVEITDLALLEYPGNLIDVAAQRIADQAANSIDVLVRDVIAAGASVKYANGTVRSAVSATITGAMVKQMVGNLRSRNVPAFPDGFYRAIVSANQAYDLTAETTANTGWTDTLKYTNSQALLANEIGEFAGVRFMVTSNAKVFATAGAGSADVHSAVFFGPNAFGVGDLQTFEARYVAPGGDHSDPIAQKAIVGAKVAIGAAILKANGPRYVRLETGATTL